MWVPTPVPPPKPRTVAPRPLQVVHVVNSVSAEVSDDLAPVGDGYCVAFVKAHGFAEYSGDAWEWKRYNNTKNPQAGDVVVLREGKVGHVALIESVSSQSLNLIEQNYKGRYVVSRRTIPKDYARIEALVSPP